MSSNFTKFEDLEKFMDKFNLWNMIVGLFLVVFGILSNIVSLLVLVYPDKKSPKITGSKYLVFLTVINIFYLLIHFYIDSINRVIYNFDLYKSDNFLTQIYLFDTNANVCKLFSYFKYVCRISNANLTISYSLERVYAIYYPFRMRLRKIDNGFFVFVSILTGFIFSSYLLYFVDTVPIEKSKNDFNSNSNFSSNFNLMSLRPTFEHYFCSVKEENFKILFKFHGIIYGLILISYLAISFSIIAIILKIKQTQKSKKCSVSQTVKINFINNRISLSKIDSNKNFQNQRIIKKFRNSSRERFEIKNFEY